MLPLLNVSAIQQTYDTTIERVQNSHFQDYQMRRDQIIGESDDLLADVVNQMLVADASFFKSSLPRCQEYLECASVRETEGFKPVQVISRRLTLRDDINERMTDSVYFT